MKSQASIEQESQNMKSFLNRLPAHLKSINIVFFIIIEAMKPIQALLSSDSVVTNSSTYSMPKLLFNVYSEFLCYITNNRILKP